MKLDKKNEIRIWSIYFLTLSLSIYTHELGHCIPAWIEGVRAIPTPAKEYLIGVISTGLQQQVALAGILGTVLFAISVMIFFLIKDFRYSAAILAGAIAMPGMYTFRFFLVGRGHDATEFQEAQAALGLNYSGHFIDWLFLVLFLSGIVFWVIKSKPNIRITGRLLVGFVLTAIFVVVLQVVNNAIFDPVFQ